MSTQTTGGTPSTDITHLLVRESGRLSGDIYRRSIDTSGWLKLQKQGKWPNGIGDNLNVLTYERTMPATPNWQSLAATSNKFCIPDAVVVPVAQTMQNYGLAHVAVESDPICVHDVRFGYKFREQLKNILDNLTENVAWLWIQRHRDQYADWAHHSVVAYQDPSSSQFIEAQGVLANVGGTIGVAGATGKGMPEQDNTPAPFVESRISRLTQGMLNRFYAALIRDGGAMNPMGRADGQPVFTLITSMETSERIQYTSKDGTRDDYRYSAKVSELLKPLGVERQHRGFFHVIDPFPPRWNYDPSAALGSRWTKVEPYIADTASYQGKQGSEDRWIVNPAYETAEYEDSFIFHQDVTESLIPTPLSTGGANTQFDPLKYRGDFKFKNIPDKHDNPDGSWGYFRGVLANGAKPCKPQYGYRIRHKRCFSQYQLLDCDDNEITVNGVFVVQDNEADAGFADYAGTYYDSNEKDGNDVVIYTNGTTFARIDAASPADWDTAVVSYFATLAAAVANSGETYESDGSGVDSISSVGASPIEVGFQGTAL